MLYTKRTMQWPQQQISGTYITDYFLFNPIFNTCYRLSSSYSNWTNWFNTKQKISEHISMLLSGIWMLDFHLDEMHISITVHMLKKMYTIYRLCVLFERIDPFPISWLIFVRDLNVNLCWSPNTMNCDMIMINIHRI